MSICTHIAGVVRFDGLAGGFGGLTPQLGNTCGYRDPKSIWDACDVPLGCEGSLQHFLWQNPDSGALARWTAMFWGDLRDYESEQEIIDYFTRITTGKLIRGACFVVRVEGSPERSFRWDEVEECFVETTPLVGARPHRGA